MNINDRVKINFDKCPDWFCRNDENPEGLDGTVTSIDNVSVNHFSIIVTWDNGTDNAYDESHLELIT